MDQTYEKYFCQACRGERKHIVLFEKKTKGSEDEYNFQWINRFRVIECAGCENISFLKMYGDNFMMREDPDGGMEYYEDAEVYPPYLYQGEELSGIHQVPENIKSIYKETINALKVGSLLLTAAGFRALIEATCNHLKIKHTNLAERIDLLHSNGYLTKAESRRLHSIRFLGNSALHEIQTPKADQLVILLSIVNHLLSNLFISDKLLKSKLDIPLDNYEDFTNVIKRSVRKDMIGTEVELDDLLGKAKRLMSNKDYKSFTASFTEEAVKGAFDFLELSEAGSARFKVLKESKVFSTFDIGL
ncbi:DUF4145 domain-containing protein [Pedobacter sp. WC2423]|uniref:DUF4145 domain-containing protein n=1 Tax=Pedobacter sp. WC2423 TaxID=3234142 RepID=UPI0034674D14